MPEPDEQTPKQKHKTELAGLEQLWKDRQINFRELRTLVNRAITAYQMLHETTSDQTLTNPIYIRNVPCGVCKGKVTARRITNGYIIKCDCSEVFNDDFHAENNKLWKRRD